MLLSRVHVIILKQLCNRLQPKSQTLHMTYGARFFSMDLVLRFDPAHACPFAMTVSPLLLCDHHSLCCVVATDAGPTALPDTYSTYANQPVLLDPTANDFSPTGSLLQFVEWVTVPGLGTIDLAGNGTVGQYIYTPQPGMQGVDTVNYTAHDDRNNTAVGVVSINIGKWILWLGYM